jgi:hypothetical protein
MNNETHWLTRLNSTAILVQMSPGEWETVKTIIKEVCLLS